MAMASLMEPFKPFLAFAKTDSNITGPVDISESLDETISENINETQETSDYSSHLAIESENIIEQPQTNEEYRAFENINEEKNTYHVKASLLSTPSTSKPVIRKKAGSNRVCKRSSPSEDTAAGTVLDYLQNKKKQKNDELTPTDMIFLGYSQTLQTFSPRRQAQTKMKIAAIMTEQECLHLEGLTANNQVNSGGDTYIPPSSLCLHHIYFARKHLQRAFDQFNQFNDLEITRRNQFNTISSKFLAVWQ
ncbi:unnamed protein product [Ceutorhynchus assimilis]|uniref:Uncharacterized protein n=1 Tax=Ceutorhynchus assimilis TaxID=467358 RepID=A0A9N9MXG9_9CUCU|nr:unnamed protein product [Ceutorhynchus assimilis]